MNDKYIPELIMSVLRKKSDERILNSPVLRVDPCDDYRDGAALAIRFSDLKEILDDIFKEEK